MQSAYPSGGTYVSASVPHSKSLRPSPSTYQGLRPKHQGALSSLPSVRKAHRALETGCLGLDAIANGALPIPLAQRAGMDAHRALECILKDGVVLAFGEPIWVGAEDIDLGLGLMQRDISVFCLFNCLSLMISLVITIRSYKVCLFLSRELS